MSKLPYVRTEFKIKAVIDGTTFEDVVSISATFGLNAIPTATLQVATGKNVRTQQDATIHSKFSSLKPRSPAKVTLTVKTNDGEISKMMPDGEYVIFEGYYAGLGYQRSYTSATVSLHLLHWIDDLNCSSMMNGNWFQNCPHDMAVAASNYSIRPNGGGIIAPIVDIKPDIVTLGNMGVDLWGLVIKPVFEATTKFWHPKQQSAAGGSQGSDSSGYGGGDNKAAMDALKRIPGDAPIPGKLPLRTKDLSAITFENNVNEGITHMLISGMNYSSFWGKLVGELGASFLFAVSPSVEFANVIPYFGGLSEKYMDIYADEYNYATFNCSVANLIESVDMYYPMQGHSGILNGGKPGPFTDYYEPWGRYPRNNQDFRGHILVRDPPVWISNAAPVALYTPGTALATNNGDCHCPQRGKETPSGGAKRPAEAEKEIKTSKIVDDICEHWFKSAVLGQRHGELSGKLRFDIAPGSIVKVHAAENEIGGMKLALFGAVTQVSYVINAEQHVAGTSFSFTNLRTETENQNDKLTRNEPPLYKKAWKGGPLAVKK